MNRIDDSLKKLAPLFNPGGRLERWYPLYEAIDSFIMGSRRTTSSAPHIRDGIDLKRIMIIVVISLIPCVIMAIWNTGYQANLALQSMGISYPTGWRGTFMQLTSGSPN
ncbi:MAG: RnfABCDGE type electron transport complex subunit D, partial [Desulfobulbaceae bacterium]|nr:RnfABCDGE type electron transport complex subunit D [Desulfobulbaceae bacterium]